MAHYAFINDQNIVVEVIVGKDETENIDGMTPEQWYSNFRGMTCIRTSYNNNIRGHFAGLGDTYDPHKDIFIAPQPFPSWTLQNDGYWKAPVSCPEDCERYAWNETEQSWAKA